MISQKTPFPALSVALLALLLFMPVAAQAGPHHSLILELEFSSIARALESCPVESVVVISATDCDGAMLAEKIVDELNANGLDAGPLAPLCGFSYLDEDFECAWNVPAHCEHVGVSVTVELGSTCGDSSISGKVFEPSSLNGFFFFKIE